MFMYSKMQSQNFQQTSKDDCIHQNKTTDCGTGNRCFIMIFMTSLQLCQVSNPYKSEHVMRQGMSF